MFCTRAQWQAGVALPSGFKGLEIKQVKPWLFFFHQGLGTDKGIKSWICGIKVDSFMPIEDKYTFGSLRQQLHCWMTKSIHVFIGPVNVPLLKSASDITFTHEHVHLVRIEQEKVHEECELTAIDQAQSFMIMLSFTIMGSSKIKSVFLVEVHH